MNYPAGETFLNKEQAGQKSESSKKEVEKEPIKMKE
jgi:hypothetical protein